MENKSLHKDDRKWLKKRKFDKITQFISAFILFVVLLRLNDLVFLLVFFYLIVIFGVVTMTVELIRLLKNK